MSAKSRLGVIAVVAGSLTLSGCLGMNQMFMSDEQEAQYCDAYRSQLNMAQNSSQRAQIISAMNQMDCPNTPAQ
jgi:hypothetical protein